MKTKSALILISIFIANTCLFSQETSNKTDSLYVTRSLGEFSFFQNGIEVKKRDYRDIISSNPEAKELFRQANNKGIVAGTFNFVGWFGIGWTLGSFLASDSPEQVNWTMGIVGIGSLLISLPIASSAMDSHRAAAKKFNHGRNNNLGYVQHRELLFQVSPNRIGFQLNF